jgi:hypothetical protein
MLRSVIGEWDPGYDGTSITSPARTYQRPCPARWF